MKLERLLAIVMILMNKNKVTAKELSECFEVSVRTIQRDMEAINVAGIPIVSYKGHQGGYAIVEGYQIDKSIMTESEQQLLLTALQGVYQAYDDQKLQNVITKLSAVNRQPSGNQNEVVLDFSPWGNSLRRKQKMEMLKRAIEETRLVEFKYTDINGISTNRRFEPYTLFLKVNSWYVYGYCHLRKDFRLFKLTRTRDICLLEETFSKREEIPKFTFDTQRNNNVTLNLKFHPTSLNRLDDYFEMEDLVYGNDGFIYVTISYPEDEWVYGMLLSFGDQVEVMEPQHIREILKTKAEKMIQQYQ